MFLDKISNWLSLDVKKLRLGLRHAILTLSTLLLSLAIFLTFESFPKKVEKQVTSNLCLTDSCLTLKHLGNFEGEFDSTTCDTIRNGKGQILNINCKTHITEIERKTINSQYQEINNRLKNHLFLANKYYSYHLAFSSLATFFGIISAIILVFIARKGIDNINAYVINLFLSSVFVSILSVSLPSIFKDNDNYNENVWFLEYYMELKHEVEYYSVNCNLLDGNFQWPDGYGRQLLPSSITVRPDQFIAYVNACIINNFRIPVDIDETKIQGYKDIFNSINQNLTIEHP